MIWNLLPVIKDTFFCNFFNIFAQKNISQINFEKCQFMTIPGLTGYFSEKRRFMCTSLYSTTWNSLIGHVLHMVPLFDIHEGLKCTEILIITLCDIY